MVGRSGSYLKGFIPLRGFIDKGQSAEGRPHDAWIPAGADAAFNATAFAVGGQGWRRLPCHPGHGPSARPGPGG
jgi:hypothetical protein